MTDFQRIYITAAMTNIETLVDQFSAKFELSSQTEERLLSQLRSHSVIQIESHATHSAVALSPVSTFVAEKSFHNFAVPRFATHWGVVCDFPYGTRTLFHLLYNPSTRKMTFEYSSWKEEWSKHDIKAVGTTPYQFPQVNRIGHLPF